MGEGSVTQSRYLEMVAERDAYKMLCQDIAFAVIDEGVFPKYHKAVLNRHKNQWPFLWKRIDSMIEFLDERGALSRKPCGQPQKEKQ
jgi:hypothetical protein